MKKDIIKRALRDFHTSPLPAYTRREVSVPVASGKIITLIGARRSGKTYLLYQLVDELLCRGVPKEWIFFFNMEDERIDPVTENLDLLIQAYRELYPGLDLAQCHFLLDEIQNVPGWERFARRLHERISKNVYITGSNARLLGTEIATALRGRTLTRSVYPFCFRELLRHHRIGEDQYDSKARSCLESKLDEYLAIGGFPEAVTLDGRLRNEVLQEYFQVMLLRDLAERYRISNITALRYFLKRMAASATKQISIHRIYNDLKSAGIRIGKNALYEFLQAAQDIFLIHVLPRYSPKASTRELGEKKVYFIDNGLLDAIRYRFSEDKGKAMEQIVYWHLKANAGSGAELSYFRAGAECDFILEERQGTTAYQCCYSLEDPQTRQREIKGLLRACQALDLESGTIVTRAEKDEITAGGVRMDVVPLVEFLLEMRNQ